MISDAWRKYNETHQEIDWGRAVIEITGPLPTREIPLDETPVKTKRDNYGLAGSVAKKAKNLRRNAANWRAFQEAVKP